MRFVFLQFGMTAYQDACLRALHKLGHDILNIFPEEYENAEFDVASFRDYGEALTYTGEPPAEKLIKAVEDFRPDVVIMVSWQQPVYRTIVARLRGKALRVLHASNVWEATPKQWLGRATHRFYLDPLYDAVFVPGDRSEWFMRRLGFRADQVIRGTNSADVETFDRGPRDPQELASRRRFLFTGRLMPYKGVRVLVDAWKIYRDTVEDPWDLDVVGTGEMADELAGLPGVHLHGFVQPPQLAEIMHSTTCLVLPSYIDFFGVVVHEAAICGQVLLCSEGVGATPYLLQDGFNGFTVASGNARSVADGLARVSALTPDRLAAMSEGSRAL